MFGHSSPPGSVGSGFAGRFCTTTRVLPQAPAALYVDSGEGAGALFPVM
jgi:hypothetical protein